MKEKTITVTIDDQGRATLDLEGFAGKGCEQVFDDFRGRDLVSLAMEGKFATDGLQAIEDGDDILMAMARELVTEEGIGERANAVWKGLVDKQAEVFGVRAVESSPSEIQPSTESVPEGSIPPVAPIPAVVTQLMMFGMSHEAVRRRKISRKPPRTSTLCDQLGLFRG